MSQLNVTASSLNVREVPSLQGKIIGHLFENDLVEKLDTSEDQKWLKVQKSTLVGWSSQKFLRDVVSNGQLDVITQIASSSAIATFNWPGRGIAPRGYIKGMALAYARVYCKFRNGDAFAVEMAKANTGNLAIDALAHYADEFDQLDMDNDASGVDTLRHLFVLLIGLGMRESSGRWCEGRDRSASNTTSDTAEAGLFQTSWNARSASPLLTQLFNDYQINPTGFLDIFKEGVTVRTQDLENFGSGDGKKFQQLSKEYPQYSAMRK
jgi:hypothetical protein